LLAATLFVLGAVPAAASGNLLCSVEDETFTINLEGVFSHGLGEALQEAKGEVEIKADLGELAKALSGKPLALPDVKQFWMHGQELKVRLYRDAEGEAKGNLEIVIETAREGDDETDFAGTYVASVRRLDTKTGAEEESVSGRGPIACSAG
jgi:hypothetical protein